MASSECKYNTLVIYKKAKESNFALAYVFKNKSFLKRKSSLEKYATSVSDSSEQVAKTNQGTESNVEN